nr:hypothetical protein [uncultured Flavobacterium sp.]
MSIKTESSNLPNKNRTRTEQDTQQDTMQDTMQVRELAKVTSRNQKYYLIEIGKVLLESLE